MKNKVIRNFLVFIGFWLVIVIGSNLIHQRGILDNFPWEVLLIFLLSLIQVTTKINRKQVFGIYFVVFFVFMLLTGGYYNWTSLVIFAAVAIFMLVITYFIGSQFKKGENSK